MKKLKWILGLALVVVAAVSFKLHRRVAVPIAGQTYRQMFDEIMSVEFVFRAPTPDHSGSTLAYIHGAPHGPGLYLLDLKTLERKLVPVTNEVTKINGWSADDRFVVFIQVPPHPPIEESALKEQWISVYDRQDGSVRRLTDSKETEENYFFWLGTNTYLLVDRPIKTNVGGLFFGNWADGTRTRIANATIETVILSDTRLASLSKGNISAMKIDPEGKAKSVVTQLSHFDPGAFSKFQWLRYSQATSNFLFCASPESSNWRYLFKWDPNTDQLTQLTFADTYNGQFIENGLGFAYVCNTNNSFYLAVRPKDSAGNTNLSVYGSVVNYTVAPDGDRIYITAAQGMEPPGIWEYTVSRRQLRLVANPLGKSFAAARLVEPQKRLVKSFDGLEIPYFLFPPATRTKGRVALSNEAGMPRTGFFKPKLKYPAVIFLPPPTWQVQKQFDAQSQFLANIGFYFVAVNYRGCDGYGKKYAGMQNVTDQARDILAVYQELLNDPDVDKNNVFILTSSAGQVVATELLATEPKLWQGVALDKPADCPIDQRYNPNKLPPFLLIMGDQDNSFSTMKKFESWVREQGVEVQSLVHANSGHITYKLSERKETLDHIARFFTDHVK